jgi:hypothetical protein
VVELEGIHDEVYAVLKNCKVVSSGECHEDSRLGGLDWKRHPQNLFPVRNGNHRQAERGVFDGVVPSLMCAMTSIESKLLPNAEAFNLASVEAVLAWGRGELLRIKMKLFGQSIKGRVRMLDILDRRSAC